MTGTRGTSGRDGIGEASRPQPQDPPSQEPADLESLYKALVDNLNVGVFVSRMDGVMLDANPAVVRMAGYDEVGEFLRAPAQRLYADPADREALLLTLQSDGVVRNRTMKSVRKDGSQYWVSLSIIVRRTASDAPAVLLGIVEDVTERVRAETALYQSEAKYRKIIETSPDAVTLTAMDGAFIESNARMASMFGYETVDELHRLAVTSQNLTTEAGRLAMVPTIPRLEAGEIVTGLVVEMRRKDGTPFPAELSVSAVRDEDGRPQGFLAVVRDISERVRVERLLLEREAQLLEAQQVARLGHYVFDVPRGVWTSSAVLDEIFGIGPDHDKSVAAWIGMVHPDCRSEMQAYLTEHVLRQRRPFDKEYMIVRADNGEPCWVHGLGKLDLDAAGNVVRMFGTIRDISGQKRAEAAHAALEERLRQSHKMEAVGLLAGGVAHDLNNLLTPILGNAELLLLRPGLAPDQARDLTEIISAAGRARDLVGQLMAFGRKQTLQMRPLDLHRLIEEFARLLRRTLREDVRIAFEPRAERPSIRADRGQIEQVLMNLAINAQDAMPAGGILTIRTDDVTVREGDSTWRPGTRPGPYVLLTVSDTGAGIDDATQARIFEPFFTTKAQGHGTGLGLATVYGIVRQHEGEVRVRSSPDAGTVFDVLLPATDDRDLHASERLSSGRLPGGTETVLIAEDDPMVRAAAGSMLARLGYRPVTAETPAQILDIVRLRGDEINVLLTDVIMPDTGGWELYARVRDIAPHIKVVYMSGYAADQMAAHEIGTAAVHFIQKPFSLDALAQKMREAIDGSGGEGAEPTSGEAHRRTSGRGTVKL